jgi:NAD-dependent deacetylase
MKHVVILSGAGPGAESGIPTFRASDGLWEGNRIEDVATPEAWARNPKRVLEFYNQGRKALMGASPNQAHRIIAELESEFEVTIITQNVDDLHERAGSRNIIHLHGSLLEARSTKDPNLIHPLIHPLNHCEMEWGELCAEGSPLRPNIIWFHEKVPDMGRAELVTKSADAFVGVNGAGRLSGSRPAGLCQTGDSQARGRPKPPRGLECGKRGIHRAECHRRDGGRPGQAAATPELSRPCPQRRQAVGSHLPV